MACLLSHALLGISGYETPMGGYGPWGGAGEELLGATLDGTAGRRPNRG